MALTIAMASPTRTRADDSGPTKTPDDGRILIAAFGAVCDGEHDDAAAIQAALDAAAAQGGAQVVVPNRECRVGEPLVAGTATTVVGAGRRSKLSATSTMEVLVTFRVAKDAGYFGGMSDVHLDCRKQARYAVRVDSWRSARFEAMEINNCPGAGFHVTSNESDDSAHHVFDQVWVRDDISSVPVGTRFALLEAGRTGKVTDSVFRDCVISATTAFAGAPVYGWELRDTSRIRLEGCRISSVMRWDASVAMTQTPDPPAGAVARDASSGWNIVRDFYHEQQRARGAIGVLIDGARAKRGQFNRDNVVDNINMQPSDATAVHVTNSGARGNALHNRVWLPQRATVAPGTVVVDPGAAQTVVWVTGGEREVSVGAQEKAAVRDRGSSTQVGGPGWPASSPVPK